MSYPLYPGEDPNSAAGFFGSPQWAGLRASGRDLSAMRRGTARVSPMQAYQQNILQRQQYQNQLQQQRLNQLKLDEAERNATAEFNPYQNLPQSIQEWRLSESDLPYDEWLLQQQKFRNTTPAAMQISQRLRELKEAGDEEGYNTLYNMARAQQPVQIGDATLRQNPYRGTWFTVGEDGEEVHYKDLNDYMTRVGGQRSFIDKQEELQATQDAEFRQAASTLPDLEGALADTRQLLSDIESGKFQRTGFLEGRYMRFNDEETAMLAAKQVLQTLKNLQITNLAPVTEAEIRLIEDLYASVLKDPEANIGALKAAIDMMQGKIDSINRMGEYWVGPGKGSLRDYGIQGRWQAPPDEDSTEI